MYTEEEHVRLERACIRMYSTCLGNVTFHVAYACQKWTATRVTKTNLTLLEISFTVRERILV